MIYAGIDVTKDKHDCFITNSDGEVLFKSFTISNNRKSFDEFFHRIESVSDNLTKVKVGLEATGHYSYNLLGFLLDKVLPNYVINPLHTNFYRKSLSLRKTKTDKVDAHTIASMIVSDVILKCYSNTSYHNEELKSLTRYRFDKVKERAKLKSSVARLINILFPELEKMVPTLHMVSVYALLSEFPSAAAIASAHLTRLANLLTEASKGHYNKETVILFREAARTSIGSHMPTKSLDLKPTIKLIQELTTEIDEIGDFSRFDSPDKILAYAGMSPSTYQSGQLDNCYAHMEKRGSSYLRYVLYNATKYVCHWDETFGIYLAKKRAEGKHYNVALSHATKKLVRVIYQLEKSRQPYIKTA